MTDFDASCGDLKIFEEIFSAPPNENIDMASVQKKICAAEVNFTTLGSEVLDSTVGLAKYMDAVSSRSVSDLEIWFGIGIQIISEERCLESLLPGL